MTTAAAGGSGGFGGAGWVSGGYTSAQVDGAGGFGSESGDDGDNPFASGTYAVCGSGAHRRLLFSPEPLLLRAKQCRSPSRPRDLSAATSRGKHALAVVGSVDDTKAGVCYSADNDFLF